MAAPLEIDPPGGPDDDESPKLRSVGDVQREMARVYRAMRKGRIAIAEGNGLTQTLQYLAKTTADAASEDLAKRLDEIEERLAAH